MCSRRTVLLALMLASVLSACTGVPTTSSPRTVQPLSGVAPSTAGAQGPPPDAAPGALVDSFLAANVSNPASSTKWLTALARLQWARSTITVITNRSASIYDEKRHRVTFTARELGSVDANGVYSPRLVGDGDGVLTSFQFGVADVGGQVRINSLQKGLLIDSDSFASDYVPHKLYFWDRANHYLVPDLRYSPLQNPSELANWLLGQLVIGPRSDLLNSVNTDTLPGQARVRVTVGSPSRVQIPGATQLASDVRNRLAAQLSATLSGVLNGTALRIDDGPAAVSIPAAGGPVFTVADFPTASGPETPTPQVYYLRSGHIRTADGAALPGRVNTYYLQSIALARPKAISGLAVAAVQPFGSGGRLLVGTQSGGLHVTTVHGQLSRPAWAPGLPEVWIGDGSQLLVVTTNGRTSKAEAVSVTTGVGGGRIVAVRFSPDGSRVALVVSGGAAGQKRAVLSVGPVVRTGTGPPQVPALVPLSPDGVVPTDVAWIDSTHLIATGRPAGSNEAEIFRTLVDGSDWSAGGTGNLAQQPDSLTAAPDALVWVSTPDGFVWEQNQSSWVSPGDGGQTAGTQPIYLT